MAKLPQHAPTQPLAASQHAPMPAALLRGEARRVARRLLGALLVDATAEESVVARIVETEAYSARDPASHSYRGRTPRTEAMFGRAGLAYVYRSYGLHWCINVSCGEEGDGAAVLLRALEPIAGLAVMQRRRALPASAPPARLCRGPGNLAQAMGVTLAYTGLDLLDPAGPLRMVRGATQPPAGVRCGPRVGITRAVDKAWRYYLAGNANVSGPRNGVALSLAGRSEA